MKIAVVGDVGVDYYTNLKLLKPGGIAFNFAYNLKKSGEVNVSLISVIGNDLNSKKILKLLKKLETNTIGLQTIKGALPKQNIILNKNERKFAGYEPGVLKKWKLRKKDIAFIKSQDAIFVPINDGMEHTFNTVKKVSGPVKAVDFSQDYEHADFDKKENVITKNAKYFDVIFVGGKKKHLKMIEALSKKYPEKVFVLTLGKLGSYAFSQHKKNYQTAPKVNVVDTTGAGDAFQAGFLYYWIKTADIKKSSLKGNQLAVKILKNIGSTPLVIR